jgi:hypothetical protein
MIFVSFPYKLVVRVWVCPLTYNCIGFSLINWSLLVLLNKKAELLPVAPKKIRTEERCRSPGGSYELHPPGRASDARPQRTLPPERLLPYPYLLFSFTTTFFDRTVLPHVLATGGLALDRFIGPPDTSILHHYFVS